MSKIFQFRSLCSLALCFIGMFSMWIVFHSFDGVFAQSDFEIEGRVVNSFTGNPVEGVTVEIAVDTVDKQLQITTTDTNGEFVFGNLPNEGPYELGFTKRNYRNTELREIFANQDTLEVELVPRGVSQPKKPFAMSSPKSVYIDWPANPEINIKGYNIYRTRVTEEGQPLGDPVKLNGVPGDVYSNLITGLEFTDDTVDKGEYYVYQIQAISGADRPSTLSEVTDPPVKGQWLTIFIPDVYHQNSGLYLWERDDTGETLIRIPVSSKCAFDLVTTSMEIRVEIPEKFFYDSPFEVATTGVTAGMEIATNLISSANEVYQVNIAAAGVEERQLHGAGELFNIYMKPKFFLEPECGILHLIEDDFPNRDGVIVYSDPFDPPVDIILEDGTYCTEGGCLHGDVNLDGLVTVEDAQHVLDYRAGLVPENVCFPDAWDINLDGRVTSADATLILRWVNGLPINPPVSTKSDGIELESFAVASALGIKAENRPQVWASIPAADIGKTVEIPVYMSNAPQLAGMTLSIAYDALDVEFVDVHLGSVFSADYLISSTVNTLGENAEFGEVIVSVGGVDNTGNNKSVSELLILEFKRIQGDNEKIPLSLTSIEINDIYGHTPRHDDPSAPIIVHDESELVQVPEVIGMSQEEAIATIEALGLVVQLTETYSDIVTQGEVISQEPSAGAEVERESTVTLIVSKGPEPVATMEVPDVIGMPQTEAIAAIEALGLLVQLTEVFDETVAEGAIIGQEPIAGTEVEYGSIVALLISKGPEPVATVEVPDVIGMPQAEAIAAIEALSLVVQVTEVYSDIVPEGDVISQEPVAGTVVEVGSSIDLVISKGPESEKRPLPICGTGQSTSNSINGNIMLLAMLVLMLGIKSYGFRFSS